MTAKSRMAMRNSDSSVGAPAPLAAAIALLMFAGAAVADDGEQLVSRTTHFIDSSSDRTPAKTSFPKKIEVADKKLSENRPPRPNRGRRHRMLPRRYRRPCQGRKGPELHPSDFSSASATSNERFELRAAEAERGFFDLPQLPHLSFPAGANPRRQRQAVRRLIPTGPVGST